TARHPENPAQIYFRQLRSRRQPMLVDRIGDALLDPDLVRFRPSVDPIRLRSVESGKPFAADRIVQGIGSGWRRIVHNPAPILCILSTTILSIVRNPPPERRAMLGARHVG